MIFSSILILLIIGTFTISQMTGYSFWGGNAQEGLYQYGEIKCLSNSECETNYCSNEKNTKSPRNLYLSNLDKMGWNRMYY